MIRKFAFRSLMFRLFLLSICLSSLPVQAAKITPAPPQVAARAYIVMDADTGKVIMASREDERFPPASLTKMMTSYILEGELTKGNISKNDMVPVSVKAWRAPGSRMFIQEGTQVLLSDLLKGIIIQSGNDASVAVAEYIAGSEAAFADMMNQHAALLGMKNSHFMNATGLPAEDHYSSAYDLALLAQAIIQKYPEQYGVYSEKYFTYNKIRQPNRNKLLWRDDSVDGLKTGHTDAAGYCLVASAKRDGMRLITVVMGTSSEEARAQESQKLLAYAFRYFRTHKLYDAGQVLETAKVWAGQQNQLKVGLENAMAITIPRGEGEQLQAVLDLDKVIKAPIEKGQSFGSLKVMLEDKVVAEAPVIALESIAEAGLLQRIWDAIALFFYNLIN
ncbi:D-alanyl-D-alanine carboxypeptidase (penicillin-binding protein 5/6) [Amphritea atlantica]|jgi:D-alanyl-D-alanine carboxypeptidase (penicillin-binding protein 5/6)|uniref:serine-type D-Ala-D-Ala carboxypeptidase n=1 Tax=Amphritea atlantica TaxID=355243 RepID=A0A1H9LYN5_9GAMM|nr:D-alanyl-D-alanine carboxypeptidase family protein [Amphritea atlantica]SER16325.1 D-alanyl-D-alanine carboxypeptidase (penicillin-binding protein 5/6) [Amphritea atlantica]